MGPLPRRCSLGRGRWRETVGGGWWVVRHIALKIVHCPLLIDYWFDALISNMDSAKPIPAKTRPFRFDPVDLDLIRLKFSIPPEKRLQAMLNARAISVSAIRSRLRQQYPDLTNREINLKLFEEIDRARCLE